MNHPNHHSMKTEKSKEREEEWSPFPFFSENLKALLTNGFVLCISFPSLSPKLYYLVFRSKDIVVSSWLFVIELNNGPLQLR